MIKETSISLQRTRFGAQVFPPKVGHCSSIGGIFHPAEGLPTGPDEVGAIIVEETDNLTCEDIIDFCGHEVNVVLIQMCIRFKTVGA